MQFTNLTNGALKVPSLGFTVEAGEQTPILTDDQAAGFAMQTDIWGTYTAPDEGDSN